MFRHRIAARLARITVLLLAVTLAALPALAQTDAYSIRLQQSIDQLNAELEFYRAYRLDEPGMMSTSGQIYGDMTGRFTESEIITMPQAEFLRIATDYWSFASDGYLARGISFSDFLKSLYQFSDEIRRGLREQVTYIKSKRDAMIDELEQRQDNPPPAVATADGWTGRWDLTRTQVTGHVSSTIGPVYETYMVVRILPDGSCKAEVRGFDVVICRVDGTGLYLESHGGWAGDTSFEIYRNGDRLTGTFFSAHPNSGEATGRLTGQRTQ